MAEAELGEQAGVGTGCWGCEETGGHGSSQGWGFLIYQGGVRDDSLLSSQVHMLQQALGLSPDQATNISFLPFFFFFTIVIFLLPSHSHLF